MAFVCLQINLICYGQILSESIQNDTSNNYFNVDGNLDYCLDPGIFLTDFYHCTHE